jgi:hypothetical protein
MQVSCGVWQYPTFSSTEYCHQRTAASPAEISAASRIFPKRPSLGNRPNPSGFVPSYMIAGRCGSNQPPPAGSRLIRQWEMDSDMDRIRGDIRPTVLQSDLDHVGRRRTGWRATRCWTAMSGRGVGHGVCRSAPIIPSEGDGGNDENRSNRDYDPATTFFWSPRRAQPAQ